ncbi:MAG: hypothetical protein ACO3A4_08815 [Silvanigrellaceae bacterium]
MKLKGTKKIDLRSGCVVVYRARLESSKGTQTVNINKLFTYKLAIVVGLHEHEIGLAPFGAIWDEDDSVDPWAHPSGVPKSVSNREYQDCLAIPEWEVGDPLIHRGRPAKISETKAGDMHVSLHYTDTAGGTFYGNLVWMDVAPALDLIDDSTAWPALS